MLERERERERERELDSARWTITTKVNVQSNIALDECIFIV